MSCCTLFTLIFAKTLSVTHASVLKLKLITIINQFQIVSVVLRLTVSRGSRNQEYKKPPLIAGAGSNLNHDVQCC